MAYSTQNDLEKRGVTTAGLAELADDDDAIELTDVVAAGIADADSLIDGYLAVRYVVPFAPVPALITKLSTDIAVYLLYSHRPHVETPEIVIAKYKAAIALLRRIARGEVLLPGAATVDETAAVTGGAQTVGAGRIHTFDTLGGF